MQTVEPTKRSRTDRLVRGGKRQRLIVELKWTPFPPRVVLPSPVRRENCPCRFRGFRICTQCCEFFAHLGNSKRSGAFGPSPERRAVDTPLLLTIVRES